MQPLRRMVPVFLAALMAVGLASRGAGAGRAALGPKPPPNVLVILTDDQRADSLTMSVLPKLKARIQDEGFRARRAFTTTPLCCPARASIMTGQYAHNHGVITNRHTFQLNHETTIQYYLSQAGYSTALFGKYLNKWETDPPFFDTWAYSDSTDNPLYYDEDWNVDGTWQTISQYSTDYISDRAVGHLESLEAADEQPWFMLLSPLAPHYPATPAERHAKSEVPHYPGDPAFFEEDLGDKPRWLRDLNESTLDQANERIADQLRTLLAVDELVEAVDVTLRDLNERRDTLVIFLSDNGHNWGEHRLLGQGVTKDTPYTPAVKIPLLIRWPGHHEPGYEDRRLVANIDVAPTILDAAGIKPTHLVDGRSLLDPTWDRSHLFIEHFRKAPGARVPDWFSVRTKDAQYVETYSNQGKRIFKEFYDIEVDPHQVVNLLKTPPRGDVSTWWVEEKVVQGRSCAGTTGPGRCR